MCGITITISPQINPAQMMSMNDLIRHRGPNDEGYTFFSDEKSICLGGADTPANAYVEQTPYKPDGLIEEVNLPTQCHMAFGHRRLAIVDLSSLGHQPMCDSYRRYWITYNGEIYNHLEIRAELEALGHQFVSHSDTEVILAAYRQWGESCLSRFNGMWAFAIYDRQEDFLFVARDRFGVKPLYYWISPQGELAFASEIKQFTAMNGWRAKVNPQRTYDFLAWGLTDHTDETLFDRVFQLAPGCCLSLTVKNYLSAIAKDGRLAAKRWYQLTPREFSGNIEDAAVAFRQHLTDAVALRLRADVSVGSCLSGGLDSSSIVCLMNQLLHEKNASALQKTFSACANVKRFDEREWIDEVVNATRVDAHYVYPEFEQLFDEVSEITWHQDEPFGSTSIYAQWHVFRAAAENGVTVMLDGQGADEQLAGYHNFFSPRLGGLFKSGHWLSVINEMRAMRRIHGYSPLTGLKFLANAMLPESIRDVLRRKAGKTNASPAWLDVDRLGCVPKNPHLAIGAVGASSIQALSIAQLTASNLQMLLHWEDRDSMAHSVESRVPFLDYRLVEFVIGLPDEFKLANGITKLVLRSSMSGILPDVIRDRMDKLGFVTPEEVWIRERATHLFRNKLELAVARTKGVVRHDALKFFDEIVDGKRPFDYMTWRLISFGEWLERFDVATA